MSFSWGRSGDRSWGRSCGCSWDISWCRSWGRPWGRLGKFSWAPPPPPPSYTWDSTLGLLLGIVPRRLCGCSWKLLGLRQGLYRELVLKPLLQLFLGAAAAPGTSQGATPWAAFWFPWDCVGGFLRSRRSQWWSTAHSRVRAYPVSTGRFGCHGFASMDFWVYVVSIGCQKSFPHPAPASVGLRAPLWLRTPPLLWDYGLPRPWG